MSPLLTRPNIGYPDWQRITDWDGPVILSEVNTLITGSLSSAILPVGRFGYIAGLLSAGSGQGQAIFKWYADSAATVFVGERSIVLNGGIANPAQLRLPNMGPYLQVTFATAGFGNWHVNATLLSTNRYHPCEFIPIPPFVLHQAQTFNANQTLSYFATDYFAGPVHILGNFDVGHYIVNLQSNDAGGNLVTYDISPNETFSPFEYSTIAPSGFWVLNIEETSGVGGGLLTMTVTPSLTGSS